MEEGQSALGVIHQDKITASHAAMEEGAEAPSESSTEGDKITALEEGAEAPSELMTVATTQRDCDGSRNGGGRRSALGDG